MKPVTNNRTLEARRDTIVFTGPPFDQDTLIAGEISATVHLGTDVETADLFVRVNRVSASGQSTNVTDAIRRYQFA